MANKTFPQLPAISSTNSADKVPIWDESGGVAAHITIANLATDVLAASGVDIAAHVADTTIHIPINDAGTGSEHIWSAQKIAAYVAANAQTGVLLADGSVAMTGDLNLAGTEIVSSDADTKHTLGRTVVGHVGAIDYAGFAHRDRATITDYALLQRSTGETIVNAASGQSISFRINNLNRFSISNTSINLLLPTTSTDTDYANQLGRAIVGYDGTNSDRAIFAHRNHATSTNAAFGQAADGVAYINSPVNVPIRIASNGVEGITAVNGKLGIGETGPEVLLHVMGTTTGDNTLPGDTQLLIENNGTAGIALRSGSSGTAQISFVNISGNTDEGRITYTLSDHLMRFNADSAERIQISSTSLRPTSDNSYDLGSLIQRYDDIYATSGAITTSDRNQKKYIKASALGLDFVNALRPVSFQWKSTPARKAKKDGRPDRTHYGLIAQEVEAVLTADGIDTNDFAGYIANTDEEKETYGLRYNEFIGPMIKAIQELSTQVKELQNGL